MGAFRFVHAADIHLDSPLLSLAFHDPDLSSLVGNATRSAFVRIIDLCLDERVDALVIAGDLYDGEQTSMKTARFLAEQLRRLADAGIRTFIVRGNHDALSKITKELLLPDAVKVFGGWAGVETLQTTGGRPVAIHGLSFSQPRAPESLLGKYKPPVAGAINIGILHTSLGGSPPHDPYAPCGVGDLEAMGYDYWALGHIHKRSVWRGRGAVVMPGNTQGRDVNESGPKSVTLVTIADNGAVTLEERVTSLAEFARVTIDVSRLDDWSDVVGQLRAALRSAKEAAISDHLIARIAVSGASSLAWRLRADTDLLRTEAQSFAAELGGASVEKLDVLCFEPARAEDGGDPLIELHQLIKSDVLASDAFRDELKDLAQKLRASLPMESRPVLGSDERALDAILAELAADGAEDVLARLRTMSATRDA